MSTKSYFLLIIVFAICSSIHSAQAAVTGKVSFGGKAPSKVAIKMNSDKACLQKNGGKPVFNEELILNNNSLGNVLVYVKEGAKPSDSAPAQPVIFDQAGCMYSPHVVGLQVNQTFKIVNSDPTLHNVNATAKQNKGFNMGMPKVGQVIEKTFSKPELPIKVKCDVHGWMKAYIGVFNHPYFSVSNETGSFEIKNLPAGDYTLAAWHEKLGEKIQKVTVTDGASQKVDFAF